MKPFARILQQAIAHLALRWKLKKADGGAPCVFYAGKVPSPGKKASGGAVKMGYLSRKYPDGGYRGNLLYLVSSALPKAPLAWAIEARKKSITVVLNQNGVAYPAWAAPEVMKRINERNHELAELSHHIVFQSDFCRNAYGRWVGKVPANQSIIYNPVDTDHFRPPAAAEKITSEIVIMGSSAQPDRIRLPLEVIALAKKRGERLRLRIAGKLHWPRAEEDLSQWLADLDISDRVEWLGTYQQEDAPAIYGSAQLLLHMQDKDASPTVPLEAMACGLPVVAIQSGGLPELVPERAGLLLPVQEDWDSFHYPSPESILDAVWKCMENRKDFSQFARTWVAERFSLPIFLEKHEQVFRDVLARTIGQMR